MCLNAYHSVFHLREDYTLIPLIDDIEIHFIELPKLDDRAVPVEGGLVNWLLFLKGADKQLGGAGHERTDIEEGDDDARIPESGR